MHRCMKLIRNVWAHAETVQSLMKKPDISALLTLPELAETETIKLTKEQSIEWIDPQGLWNTVRLDRLHLISEGGDLKRIQLIDYKTDDLADPAALRTRHQDQLTRYTEALTSIYGEIPVENYLVNVTWGYLC